MKAPGAFHALGWAALLPALSVGCGQKAQSVTLRSLESSGRVSFVCLADVAPAGTAAEAKKRRSTAARSLDACPDTNPSDGETRRLYSLVTQQTRGELAVVDLIGGAVVDEEPSVPGFNFLPIGAEPGAVVSTPGSVATFVGVGEVGKEGIFAIPSSCTVPRNWTVGEPARDITSWAACRLPVAPGDMAVLLDTQDRESCDGSPRPTPPKAQSDRECPADLTQEQAPGRRVLAVSLPDLGGIALIDAQELLDRAPGAYEPCKIDSWIPLRTDGPTAATQELLPPDLDDSARRPALPHGPVDTVQSRPAGFASLDDPTTGEHRLFVADLDAPVIHDLDTSDVCARNDARPPLLPVAFDDPGRIVTTKKVAVSPLTTLGERFLYAVDERDTGSIMVFDVSPGATERTPLVRPRSMRTPFEPPDRILFDAPVEDVTFALRDVPVPNAATGVQPTGVLCDPDPNAMDGGLYWPKPDFSSGANSDKLRGVFGFAALSSGSVVVIDVQDFDAPCRRPTSVNPAPSEDFRGCSRDTATKDFVGPPDPKTTVTGEVSCQVVERHRTRSSSVMHDDTDTGIRAPSLRTRPKLFDKTGRSLSVDVSPEGQKHPHVLGVNFGDAAAERAQVYVGTTLFEPKSKESPLDINPASATESSVVLSFAEPRSYPAAQGFSTVYEGTILENRLARFDYRNGQAALTDGSLVYCDLGVEDVPNARIRGTTLGVDEPDLDLFASQHADMVIVKSELLAETDAYWQGEGANCGTYAGGLPGSGHAQCLSVFGPAATPSKWRELSVIRAAANQLDVEPRNSPSGSKQADTVNQLIQCCFPDVMSYEIRVSDEWVVRPFTHDISTDVGDPERHCIIDQSPLRALLPSRVVEVSCDPRSSKCVKSLADGSKQPKSIGLANLTDPRKRDVACVVQDPETDVQTIGHLDEVPPRKGSRYQECIHQGLTAQFVIYRGQTRSERDMQFGWEVRGGFVPLSLALATRTDPNSLPASMVYSKELGDLVIADGSTKGLVLLNLATFSTSQYY